MQIIAIDGPNLVGKTTLINEIGQSSQIKVYHDNELFNYINHDDKYPFFFARLRFQEALLKKSINGIIILDRWFISQFVFDFFPNVDQMCELIGQYHLIIPDQYYVLMADESTLKKRLQIRKKEDVSYSLKMPLDEQITRYCRSAELFGMHLYYPCEHNEIKERVLIYDV